MAREAAYGERRALTGVDRFGVWLSGRGVRRAVATFDGVDLADVGCGYEATFARSVLGRVGSATLVDVSVAEDLAREPNVTVLLGELPEVLARVEDASLDVTLCLSVLEHLWEPEATLEHLRRVLRPGGTCAVNVPSWLGKRFLEFSAFKLGLSPAVEMDDHKRYYDPKDLWPLLVRAGFPPHGISCRRHKFGLNTFAVCRLDGNLP